MHNDCKVDSERIIDSHLVINQDCYFEIQNDSNFKTFLGYIKVSILNLLRDTYQTKKKQNEINKNKNKKQTQTKKLLWAIQTKLHNKIQRIYKTKNKYKQE